MFQTCAQAIDWMTRRRNENLGHEHFRHVMEQVGNPQDSFKTIHVAGTNGKGSVVNMLKDLAMSQGKKVGTFTSPHFQNHRDRIRINDNWIDEATFLSLVNQYLPLIEQEQLNMFEIDFLLMAVWFKQQRVDVAMIEVGLGGRLDATNVLTHPELCIITTIGYDHMERLGNTPVEIAQEKAGILKSQSRYGALIGNLPQECEAVIKRRAEELNISFATAKTIWEKIQHENKQAGTLTCYPPYKKENAQTALAAWSLLGNGIGQPEVQLVQNSHWAGRFDVVHHHPTVVLDGAHNQEGICALIEGFAQLQRPIVTVFAGLKDKPLDEMLSLLQQAGDELVVTQFDFYRVRPIEDYQARLKKEEDYRHAITEAMKKCEKQGTVVICGSLYFISEVQEFFDLIKK